MRDISTNIWLNLVAWSTCGAQGSRPSLSRLGLAQPDGRSRGVFSHEWKALAQNISIVWWWYIPSRPVLTRGYQKYHLAKTISSLRVGLHQAYFKRNWFSNKNRHTPRIGSVSDMKCPPDPGLFKSTHCIDLSHVFRPGQWYSPVGFWKIRRLQCALICHVDHTHSRLGIWRGPLKK